MIFIHFSNWVYLFFMIYLLFYNSNYKEYKEYINPYYTIHLIFYGFLFYLILNSCNGVKFDKWFVIVSITLHYIPLYIFRYLNYKKNKYSFIFMLQLMLIYIIYIKYIFNKTPFDIYLFDKQSETIADYLIKIKVL